MNPIHIRVEREEATITLCRVIKFVCENTRIRVKEGCENNKIKRIIILRL